MKEALTVKEIGERTGMLAEDVVAALMEMAVCELMAAKKTRMRKSGEINGMGGTAAVTGREEQEEVVTMMVKRSRVVEWVQRHHVNLHDPVREEGYLGEWAMSEADGDDVEREEQESE